MSLITKPTTYNNETKNQLWMSVIGDTHDMFCGCEVPFAHLLDNIFPEGHKDKDKTIRQIISRDIKQCHFGGEEEKETGTLEGTFQPIKEEDAGPATGQDNEDLDMLLAAAAAAEEDNER